MNHNYTEGFSDAEADIEDMGIVFAEFVMAMFETGEATDYSRGYGTCINLHNERLAR